MHKKTVLLQFFYGFITIILIGYALWFMLPEYDMTKYSNEHFRYVAGWLLLLVIPYLVVFSYMLPVRFNDVDLIKGVRATRADKFIVERAYLTNTSEQLWFQLLSIIGLLAFVPADLQKLIGIQVSLFLIGRVLFYLGYKRDPMQRFFGFCISFYSAIVSLVITLYWSTQ